MNQKKPINTSNQISIQKIKEDAMIERTHRNKEVEAHLENLFQIELNEEEIKKLSLPFYYATLNSTISRLLCTDIKEKKQMLEDILIQKVKFTGSEELALNYDKASAAAYELSSHEIQLLVFIDTYSCILCSIINGTGAIEFPDKLCDYLESVSKFSIEDIKKCEMLFLIYDRTQYEHDLSALTEYEPKNDQIRRLTEVVKFISLNHYDINFKEGIFESSNDINLSVYTLSEIGKIISRCQIESLGTKCFANDIFPSKLSDLIADNVLAMGSSSAKNRMSSLDSFFQE